MPSSILQIENKHDVFDYSTSVIKCFENDVLPHRFSLGSLNRDNLVQDHTTDIAKKLFDIDDQLYLICDGLYTRHQRSFNNRYQRKSYSW